MQETYKIIIAGSRSFSDYDFLKFNSELTIQSLISLNNKLPIEIVSGNANGADKLGERFAIENNYILTTFKPDWTRGNHAGYVRNIEMGNYSNALIVFWDGESNGTKQMIDYAINIKLFIKLYINNIEDKLLLLLSNRYYTNFKFSEIYEIKKLLKLKVIESKINQKDIPLYLSEICVKAKQNRITLKKSYLIFAKYL